MFEAYKKIGMENIIVSDIVSGCASFFVVAFGGTIIGETNLIDFFGITLSRFICF